MLNILILSLAAFTARASDPFERPASDVPHTAVPVLFSDLVPQEAPALRASGSPSDLPEAFAAAAAPRSVVRGQMGLASDLDSYAPAYPPSPGVFRLEFLPRNMLYPFYLADVKASRMSSQLVSARDDHTLWDATVGGRFGIVRFADNHPVYPVGIQLDVEGAAMVRLDMDREHDVRSADFRGGIPLSISLGRFQTRVGYYHLSSHLGDEFLLANPGYNRLNFSRDVLFLGGAYWLTPNSRIYSEAGWAFYDDVSDPWEFQFGFEHAPRQPTGIHGAPFFAIAGHLREEVDFGGGLTVQGGWAWRSRHSTGLARAGVQYYNGKSHQFSFHDEHEELVGFGLWYDY